MESKYWFISYYGMETRMSRATVQNVIVKCNHPLMHIVSFVHYKAMFWNEIGEDVAKRAIGEGMQFEEI